MDLGIGVGVHQYKMTCWESNGSWHCNDVKNLRGKSAKWYTPMRILNLAVEEYVHLLVDKFHAEKLIYRPDAEYFGFQFSSEKDAKAFCSYVNKVAKAHNYTCS